jgi:hypothetical protein
MGETRKEHLVERSTAALLLAVVVGCGGGEEPKGAGLENAGGASGAGASAMVAGTGGTLPIGTGGAAGNLANGGNGAAAGTQANGGRPAAGASGRGGTGGGSGTGGSGARATTLTSCATWELALAADTTSSATLTDGGLVLFRPGGSIDSGARNEVEISQSGLTGDFDVVITFDSFQQGDTASFQGMELKVGVIGTDAEGSAAFGTVGGQTADVSISTESTDPRSGLNRAPNATWLDNASGTVEFAMQGGIMTATTTVKDYMGFDISAVPFTATTYELVIGITLRGSDYGKMDSSVRITSVSVTGGGGSVKSDTFDCASP